MHEVSMRDGQCSRPPRMPEAEGLGAGVGGEVCPPPLLNTPRVQAFRTWLFEEVAEYKRLCDELDARRAAGKCPAECALEGGWKGISGRLR